MHSALPILALGLCGLQHLTSAAVVSESQNVLSKDITSEGEYAVYRSDENPGFAIRVREQTDSLCDAGSKQNTGWLDAEGKHLFFWFVESLNDPNTDPLNLWMTGGPGCSGLIGMMLELGPCLINENGTGTLRNPFSWTQNASMIFIDQPAGTGFSYTDDEVPSPGDSFLAAEDVHVFLRIFYQAFPSFKSVPFHISGESYGGHYVPTVAAEIVRYNEIRSSLRSDFKIPLTSIMIGDGFVSPLDITYGYYDTLCTTKPGVDSPVFNETRCKQISDSLPRCVYLHEACYEYPDAILCQAADSFCMGQIRDLYDNETGEGGRDPFDITRTCEVDQFCYSGVLGIQDYMNSPETRAILDVPHMVPNFTILSLDIHELFAKGNDLYVNTAKEVQFVVESGVDVLVYNGNLDLACNTAGNKRWVEKLPWAGQIEFVSKEMKDWYAPKEGELVKAGTMKEVAVKARLNSEKASRLAFVTVDKAGHMVPLDQPEISLHLIQTWIAGGEISAEV